MPTYTPKIKEIERAWHVVDADGLVLGRMAHRGGRVLRGKHKPTFTPHLDTGDHVIIVNAEKVGPHRAPRPPTSRCTATPGFPAACARPATGTCWRTQPAEAVRRTVRGMLPKNRLGRQMLRKLKVYAGPVHPHEAQQPQPLEIAGARSHTGGLLMTAPLTQATGRRKRAVARVRLRPGSGQVTVNGRKDDDYFPLSQPPDGLHGPPAGHQHRRVVRHRREHARRRGQRPGRGSAAGHRPGLGGPRPGDEGNPSSRKDS